MRLFSMGFMIGSYGLIGVGTVGTKDVPDHALVMDNPGQIMEWGGYAE